MKTEGPFRALVTIAVLLILMATSAAGGASAERQDNGVIAFVGVNVVPMDSEQVLRRHTVVVQGDRIISIEPSDVASVPAGATQIESQGKYLIPGLIDVHTHFLSDDRIGTEYLEHELAVVVANGVTTIRNPIGRPEHLAYRERIANGEVIGPALYVGSPQLAAREFGRVFNGRAVRTPNDGVIAVRDFERAGYDFIKLTFGITADVYEAIILAARAVRIPVIGHVGPDVGLRRALEAGQQIEHLDQYLEALSNAEPGSETLSGAGVWMKQNWASLDDIDDDRIEEVVRATVDAEVWNTPTLAFLNSSFGTGRDDEEIDGSDDARFVSASVRDDLLRGRARFWNDPPAESRRRRYVELRNEITRRIYRAGGHLMAGSDAPEWLLLYGFTLHRELESMVAAGLPPYAALRTATRSPAVFLSRRGTGRTEYATVDENAIRFATTATRDVDFGSIDVGKRADLVLLGDNPLDDIRNTRRIDGVMLRGQWLPRAELDGLLERAATALSAAPLIEGRD